MTQPSAPPPAAAPVVPKDIALAFASGLGIGGAVWLIADAQRGNMASFTMSVVLLASASAAAVTFMISRDTRRVPVQQRVVDIHRWVAAIGGGVLAAIQALNAF